MKKIVLSAASAFALTAFAFAGAAQAQCWWTGYGYSCATPPAATYYYPPSPYAYWGGDYQTFYDGAYTGYKPAWLPSYPGPKPGSGAGR